MRWCLEDFLQYPLDPAPTLATRVEKRMAAIGAELFNAIFQSNSDAAPPVGKSAWRVEPRASGNRRRCSGGDGAAVGASSRSQDRRRAGPGGAVVCAIKQSDSAASTNTAERLRPDSYPAPDLSPRWRRRRAVPLRRQSIPERAREAPPDTVQLHVLRPPTFEQWGRGLRDAKTNGEPYHIVHFDGHGGYGDVADDPRPGEHGYLFFENPVLDANSHRVDGPKLGSLLAETDVPVLVLNACRSAHADPRPVPPTVSAETEDPHSTVRAFGALAQEVVAGVVGRGTTCTSRPPRSSWPTFTAPSRRGSRGEGLWRWLASSVRASRCGASRTTCVRCRIGRCPWCTRPPPSLLFRKRSKSEKLAIKLGKADGSQPAGLPPRPDSGFFGRDETLLALDRAFDNQSIVLLHAHAGRLDEALQHYLESIRHDETQGPHSGDLRRPRGAVCSENASTNREDRPRLESQRLKRLTQEPPTSISSRSDSTAATRSFRPTTFSDHQAGLLLVGDVCIRAKQKGESLSGALRLEIPQAWARTRSNGAVGPVAEDLEKAAGPHGNVAVSGADDEQRRAKQGHGADPGHQHLDPADGRVAGLPAGPEGPVESAGQGQTATDAAMFSRM